MIKPDYFIIQEVAITAPGELKDFEVKLPGNITHVIGFHLGATIAHATKPIATVGISFNGGRENTIDQDIIVHNTTKRRRRHILTQRQNILDNSYHFGYVKDLSNAASYPYTAKIYLQVTRQ